MKYCKVIEDGYITAIGANIDGVEIGEEEYAIILDTIRNKPTPREGFDFMLTEDLRWEEYSINIL